MTEVALHKQTKTKDFAIACEKCVSGDPALVRCGLCGIFLCDFCSQAHKRDKATYSHKLVAIEELKSLGPSALSKPVLCKVHDGMHLKLYCESCEQTICTDCVMIQHRWSFIAIFSSHLFSCFKIQCQFDCPMQSSDEKLVFKRTIFKFFVLRKSFSTRIAPCKSRSYTSKLFAETCVQRLWKLSFNNHCTS